jgi:hypothetical protein
MASWKRVQTDSRPICFRKLAAVRLWLEQSSADEAKAKLKELSLAGDFDED